MRLVKLSGGARKLPALCRVHATVLPIANKGNSERNWPNWTENWSIIYARSLKSVEIGAKRHFHPMKFPENKQELDGVMEHWLIMQFIAILHEAAVRSWAGWAQCSPTWKHGPIAVTARWKRRLNRRSRLPTRFGSPLGQPDSLIAENKFVKEQNKFNEKHNQSMNGKWREPCDCDLRGGREATDGTGELK